MEAARRAGIAHVIHEYDRDPRSTGEHRGSWGWRPPTHSASRRPGCSRRSWRGSTTSGWRSGSCRSIATSISRHWPPPLVVVGRMAAPAEAERATGYVVGGISPLGQRRRLPTVVDASALHAPTIHVSAGRRGLDLELGGADLVRVTGARVARIARPG